MQPILIVEDNALNSILLSKIVQKLGFNFEIARGGFQALDLLKKNEYSMLLTDIELIDMKAFDMVRVYRELERETGDYLPIIALTGFDGDPIRGGCFKAGIDEVVYKPYVISDLKEKIEYYLNNKFNFDATI